MLNILSVGCGHRIIEPGVIRLDISEKVNPDIIWDLNCFPYPFENSKFTNIECFDVIEHLNSIPQALEEFHRILVPNGSLKITTPHYSCSNSFVDPTHKWHLSYYSFDYFSESSPLKYYSNARYSISERHIFFQGGRFNKSLMRRFANCYPKLYEDKFAWIFPAHYLYFELMAEK